MTEDNIVRGEQFVRDSSMDYCRAVPCLVWVLLAPVAAESRFEKSSGSPYGMVGDLAEQVGTYLRQLAQEKAVVSAQKVSLMGLLRTVLVYTIVKVNYTSTSLLQF